MARRKKASFEKTLEGDVRYNSELVQRLINIVMWRGKKGAARKIVYDAMDILTKKSGGDSEKSLKLFYKAFDQLIPVVEVRARRVGGSVYQIPVEVRLSRGRALAIRWLISAAAARTDKTMGARLANEILEAADGRGTAIKKKQDTHRMAEANRAFSHYAW